MILSFSDIMPDRKLSERLWAEKGRLASIRTAFCPVADSNVKREKSARSVWMSPMGRGPREADGVEPLWKAQ